MRRLSMEPKSEPISPKNTEVPIGPSAISPDEYNKVNKLKAATIIIAIIAIIGIVAAVIFAVLYYNNTNNNANSPTVGTNSDPNLQLDATAEQTKEEVEITDVNILKDLDAKIALLFNTDNTDPTFATGRGIGYYDELLFHNGDIDQSNKIRTIIRHTLELAPLSEEEIVAALSQSGMSGRNEEYFRRELAKGVKGDLVVQKYKEIFGEDIAKGAISKFCGEYEYNTQYDFYYNDGLGCGGISPYERFYYKNRYTTDGDYAYVYTATAFLNPTTTKDSEGYTHEGVPYYVYCDIADLGTNGASEGAKICDILQTEEEKEHFTLDFSNYKQYSEYRFIFTKLNNNYYFKIVEKINS